MEKKTTLRSAKFVRFIGKDVHHGNVYQVRWDGDDVILSFADGKKHEDHDDPWTPGLEYFQNYFEPVEDGWLPPNPKKIHGASKPDLSLVPPSAIAHMAMSMEEGAWKYGAFNWRLTKVEAMTYIAAAKRHLNDYLDGFDYARDSEVHNLGAVMACCAIVLDACECGTLIDNRPPRGRVAVLHEELQKQKQRWAQEGRKQWSENSKF